MDKELREQIAKLINKPGTWCKYERCLVYKDNCGECQADLILGKVHSL